MEIDRARLAAVVGQLRGHVDGGVVRRDRRRQVRGRHRGAPSCDVQRVGDGQVDMPGDAAAGVPPAARLLVLHDNGQHVGRMAVGVDQIRDVVAVAGVAVGVVADQLAVEIDVRVLEHAVEVQRDLLARHRRREGERLAIPAQAAGEETRRVALAGIGRLGDAPVVREREALPPGVVETGGVRLGIGGVAVEAGRVARVGGVDQLEPPAPVEVERPRPVVEHAQIGVPGARAPPHRTQIAARGGRRLRGRAPHQRERTRDRHRRGACHQPETHLRLPLPINPGGGSDTHEPRAGNHNL